jgi:hypothetical protein
MLNQNEQPEREPFPTGTAIGVGVLFVAGLIAQAIEKRRRRPMGLAGNAHNLDAPKIFLDRIQEALARNLTSGDSDCALAWKQFRHMNLDFGWWIGEWDHVVYAALPKMTRDERNLWQAQRHPLQLLDRKMHSRLNTLHRLFSKKCVLGKQQVTLGAVGRDHDKRAHERFNNAYQDGSGVVESLRSGDCVWAFSRLIGAQISRAQASHEAHNEQSYIPMKAIEDAWEREQKVNDLFAKTCVLGFRDILGPLPIIPKPSSLDGMRFRRAR